MPAIANVNWAPPFQGPFVVDRGTSDYAREITAYHHAAKAFQAIISAPENQFTHMLRPGQCVIFNNRRILHGREQFNSVGVKEGQERWLKGAYLDMDDVSSTLRKVSGEGWVYEELKKMYATGHNIGNMKAESARVERIQDEAKVNAGEGRLQQINALTRTGNSTQIAAAQGTTSELPPTKAFSPELENMLEQWWQRRAQRDEQGLQQQPETVQKLQQTETDQGEQDHEDLAAELALHERRAEQRLDDTHQGESFTPRQQPISHAFAEAPADEQDSDWKVVDGEGRTMDIGDADEQLADKSAEWRNGGRLAASEAVFRTESDGHRFSRY